MTRDTTAEYVAHEIGNILVPLSEIHKALTDADPVMPRDVAVDRLCRCVERLTTLHKVMADQARRTA